MKIGNDEIRIKVSKTKAFVLAILAALFFMLCVWALFKVEMLLDGFDQNFLIAGISILLIASGLGCLSSLSKLNDSKPGLIINGNGIQINIGPNRGQFVQWNQITGLKIHNQIQGSVFLLIFVKNPEDFYSKSNNLNRFLLKMNNVSHKTPLSLTSTWLECSFEQLITIIEDLYRKNSTPHQIT